MATALHLNILVRNAWLARDHYAGVEEREQNLIIRQRGTMALLLAFFHAEYQICLSLYKMDDSRTFFVPRVVAMARRALFYVALVGSCLKWQ